MPCCVKERGIWHIYTRKTLQTQTFASILKLILTVLLTEMSVAPVTFGTPVKEESLIRIPVDGLRSTIQFKLLPNSRKIQVEGSTALSFFVHADLLCQRELVNHSKDWFSKSMSMGNITEMMKESCVEGNVRVHKLSKKIEPDKTYTAEVNCVEVFVKSRSWNLYWETISGTQKELISEYSIQMVKELEHEIEDEILRISSKQKKVDAFRQAVRNQDSFQARKELEDFRNGIYST